MSDDDVKVELFNIRNDFRVNLYLCLSILYALMSSQNVDLKITIPSNDNEN